LAITFRFLLSNEFILLLVPLAFFLLVAVARALVRKDLPMSKVWLTIKVALFGLFLGFLVHPFKVPAEYTPYFLEIHGLILLFCWANLTAYLLVELYLHFRMKGEVPTFLRELFLLGIYVFYGATALRVIFDISMASILTTTTVLTAALAFAMQNTLANIVSGFHIQSDKAFQRGTWVLLKDGQVSGEIVNVGFRYSTVRTPEGHLVHIPNHYLTQNIVHGIGSRQGQPAVINQKVLLDYAFPPARAKAVLLKALQDEHGILREPHPVVEVDGFMDNGIQYNLRFHIPDYGAVLSVRDEVLRRVWYSVTREGQTFPYPHREIVKKVPEPPFRMGDDAIRENLRRIDILGPLGDEDLDSLARDVRLRVYGIGETVVREGEEGDSLFVVLRGDLEVHVGREKVGTLAAGEFFGEMSLLTGASRRATVRTVDEVRLLEISKAAIGPIIHAHPPVAEGLSAALERRLNQILTAQQIRAVVAEAPTLRDAILKKLRLFFDIN
jgi:small-conductance mechanosensitive channel/CRP-like cAMP-binding protein